MSRTGIVNVRMVITEEKILSNIDKVQKLINPNSKKQIVQLEEDNYFKDLIESIKTYLIEYPKKKNFPANVYKAAYGLVEYATNQFEDNTKRIEELIRQREQNINLAGELKDLIKACEEKDKECKSLIKGAEANFGEDITETLTIVAKSKDIESEEYAAALKLLNARVGNLESNLHIEIDMERIEDRSKALSYIGIEVADALKMIPAPIEEIVEEVSVEKAAITPVEAKIIEPITQEIDNEVAAYTEETTFEAKPSIWEKIKSTKLVRAVSYVFKIRIRVELPNALPEGRGENY